MPALPGKAHAYSIPISRIAYTDAATWNTGFAGQGGGSYILSNLSRLLDQFLVEYLRVRDSKACRDLRTEGG